MRLLLPAVCLALAACGQSGSLYLPDEKPAAQPATPVQVVTPEEKKKEDAAPAPSPTPNPPAPSTP